MSEIDEIERKVANLYRSNTNQPTVEIPPTLQVVSFISFSKGYLSAAEAVEKEIPQCWLPIRQLLGQSIELSLKACIASQGRKPKHGHDLIKLLRDCEQYGLNLESRDIALIVHLNHFYFKDLATETKFKSRYPTKGDETLGGVVPNVEEFKVVVGKLHEWAEKK